MQRPQRAVRNVLAHEHEVDLLGVDHVKVGQRRQALVRRVCATVQLARANAQESRYRRAVTEPLGRAGWRGWDAETGTGARQEEHPVGERSPPSLRSLALPLPLALAPLSRVLSSRPPSPPQTARSPPALCPASNRPLSRPSSCLKPPSVPPSFLPQTARLKPALSRTIMTRPLNLTIMHDRPTSWPAPSGVCARPRAPPSLRPSQRRRVRFAPRKRPTMRQIPAHNSSTHCSVPPAAHGPHVRSSAGRCPSHPSPLPPSRRSRRQPGPLRGQCGRDVNVAATVLSNGRCTFLNAVARDAVRSLRPCDKPPSLGAPCFSQSISVPCSTPLALPPALAGAPASLLPPSSILLSTPPS